MHWYKQKENRKFRVTLRLYFALVAITTLCFACIISAILVILGVKLFYHEPLTFGAIILLCLLVCTLSMFFGGIMLYMGSIHLTKPIEIVSAAVQKVAKGDFTIRIPRDASKRGEFPYRNEIDELSENVNKMAAELSSMDYMRKDFMSNVSHEFKTPVAAITGFTEILLDGSLKDNEREEYLTLINAESIRLSTLCENMLRMSRLDNQQIVRGEDEIRVDEQIRKCIIMLSEKWGDHSSDYDLHLTKSIVKGNADLLMQVWTNLIDNAIKYSPQNSTIQIIETYDEQELTVIIRDNGIGISVEKLPHIFEKFYQCEESHKKQGNGLGLSIVKRIVELVHGTIHYDSEENVGTTVTVRIPIDLDEC